VAEGYARAGRTELAIAGFERALALDPRNAFAFARLHALRGGS
jgi:hypothetical protein